MGRGEEGGQGEQLVTYEGRGDRNVKLPRIRCGSSVDLRACKVIVERESFCVF